MAGSFTARFGARSVVGGRAARPRISRGIGFRDSRYLPERRHDSKQHCRPMPLPRRRRPGRFGCGCSPHSLGEVLNCFGDSHELDPATAPLRSRLRYGWGVFAGSYRAATVRERLRGTVSPRSVKHPPLRRKLRWVPEILPGSDVPRPQAAGTFLACRRGPAPTESRASASGSPDSTESRAYAANSPADGA